jgi:GMP synthase-like glutamine amidotransferase
VKTLAVVQHTSSEYLGLIEDHLEGRRIRFRYFRPFTAGGKLPGPVDLGDGLVLLGGGPFGATPGAHCLPTLGQELALTAAVLAAGRPVIGIGLGAQVLVLAAGGDVRAAPFVFEVGTASRTREDALGGYLPARYPLVRYGRDEPVLPPHARVLARDDVGRPALFECGQRAFGFSGHPGAKSAMIEDLIMEFAAAPADPEAGLLALRAARVAIEDALVPIMTGLVQCTGLMADAADGPSARPGVPGG